MRSAVIAAAFAVGALAVPYQNPKKRDLVTKTNVDWVTTTHMVTVTAGGPAPQGTAQNLGEQAHRHVNHHNPPVPNRPAPDNNQPAPNNNQPAPDNSPPPSNPSPGLLDSNNLPTPTNLPNPLGGNNEGSSGSAGSSYSDIAVFHHNIHRNNHSAPEIAWDDSLAKSAQDIAATCIYEHNTEMDGGGYGQNIAAGVEPSNISAIITDLFYNGEVGKFDGLYGEANPSMALFEEWGHFTQVVWKGTTHFGCATQDCSGKGLANVGGDVAPFFTVCNYKSPGNYGGQYGENVGEPLGQPTAQWDAGM